MGPSLQHLITFHAVVSSGSISHAARQLSYAQPTVTAHIQALEHAFGVLLFRRGPRGLTPTSAGRALADVVPNVIAMLEQARESVKVAAEIDAADGGKVRAVCDAAESVLEAPRIGHQ